MTHADPAGLLDVVVMGGGPAGSTAGHLLARAGHRVTIVDKDDSPRFHIGESLLPCDLPLFERLGLDRHVGALLHKQGAEFIDEASGDFAFYDFADALPGGPSHAYQVERASFDHALLRLAEQAGARVELRCRVQDVVLGPQAVTVNTDRGAMLTRYVVDATGQDALLGRRARSIEPLRGLGRGAVFCHFNGAPDAIWKDLFPQGNIKVLIRPDGWAWMIPLPERRLSVGFVSHVHAVEPAVLDRVIEESPLLSELAKSAARSEVRVARNFSYKNVAAFGERYACIGDAACFLDPVFSSGVSFAMLSGERLADTLSPALAAGDDALPAVGPACDRHMQIAYQSIGALVHSFYNTGLVRNIFFAQTPDPELRSGLISLLAGDLWRTDNRFQAMLLRSARRSMPSVL